MSARLPQERFLYCTAHILAKLGRALSLECPGWASATGGHQLAALSRVPRSQIRDLDKGTFGFVQQAVDLTTGEQVAIKFIERSQEVRKSFV